MSASRASYSPLSSVVTSNSLIAFFAESNSPSASASADPSGSSAANSKRSGRSLTRRRNPVSREIVACTRDNLLVSV